MLRELAVLKGIKHDHIASLELISLAKDELHVFFPYVDKTLHEVINPTGDPNGGRVLPEAVVSIARLLFCARKVPRFSYVCSNFSTDSQASPPTSGCDRVLPPPRSLAP